MAKTKISEYSATANSNTDVASINIDEGCAPSGINNAIRAIMGHLKDFQSGTSNDPFTIGSSGSLTLSYGTANSVQYLSTSKVVTSDSNFVYTTTGLGIGTSSPTTNLEIRATSPTVLVSNSATRYGYMQWENSGSQLRIGTDGAFGIRFDTNASQKMLLDSSGNLGLGVTPSGWNSTSKAFQIGVTGAIRGRSDANLVNLINNFYTDTGGTNRYISSDFATNYQQISGQHQWYTAPSWSGTGDNTISFTQAMTLDASGNLGVGTTSPSARFSGAIPAATNTNTLVCTITDGTYCDFNLYLNRATSLLTSIANISTSSGIMAFATSGTERARIDSSGNLLVNVTGIDYKLAVVGDASKYATMVQAGNTGGTYYQVAYQIAGTIVGSVTSTGSSTAYNSSSDYRLKEDIAPMTGALAKVSALKPVTYKWKSDGSDGEGFIAHELAEVVPQCVTGEKDAVDADGNPKYQGIDTSFLVATLTAAIKEQQAIIQSLTDRITALEGAKA